MPAPPDDSTIPTEAVRDSPSLEPGLYVVSTPIGNLRDITLRALDVLAEADLVLAEDTRVARKLFAAHGLSPARLLAYHDHVEEEAGAKALAALAAGRRVALISDAGTPLLSDPGFPLVRAALEAGAPVRAAPGASALLTALACCGLPAQPVLFAGFPPPKGAARRTFLARFAAVEATLVFYEAGPRLAESLTDMVQVYGPRPGAVCRELTKLFEEVRRGPLDLLAKQAPEAETRGEHVIVIGPPPEASPPGPETIQHALRELLPNLSLKDAVREVAEALRVPRREVYALALAMRKTP